VKPADRLNLGGSTFLVSYCNLSGDKFQSVCGKDKESRRVKLNDRLDRTLPLPLSALAGRFVQTRQEAPRLGVEAAQGVEVRPDASTQPREIGGA
jgi:hypothetical protein